MTENLADFHRYFHTRLLPIQTRNGARLVGRWETEDHRVVSIWEYDDRDAYGRIHRAVRSDPDTAVAEEYRRALGPLYTSMDEVFMYDTGD